MEQEAQIRQRLDKVGLRCAPFSALAVAEIRQYRWLEIRPGCRQRLALRRCCQLALVALPGEVFAVLSDRRQRLALLRRCCQVLALVALLGEVLALLWEVQLRSALRLDHSVRGFAQSALPLGARGIATYARPWWERLIPKVATERDCR